MRWFLAAIDLVQEFCWLIGAKVTWSFAVAFMYSCRLESHSTEFRLKRNQTLAGAESDGGATSAAGAPAGTDFCFNPSFIRIV